MKNAYRFEVDALRKNYMDRLPLNNPFVILIEENKELFVFSAGENEFMNECDLCSQYRSLYDTVLDNASKICFSFDRAIENTYCDEVQSDFSLFKTASEKEWLAYYYIENALFRIETLWDILAHFFNVFYSLGLTKDNVYHSKIFSDRPKYVNEYWHGKVPQDVQRIIDYFNESDDDNGEDVFWQGNYSFTNALRNQMIHKVTISESAMSSYIFALKYHPSYLLKRLTETYYVLTEFIYEVCEHILSTMPR